jgi:hypothetical protein
VEYVGKYIWRRVFGMNENMIKEIDEMVSKFSDVSFEQALPLFQDQLWKISMKYGKQGDKAFQEYMDWKSKSN